jgi:hypothetical protein
MRMKTLSKRHSPNGNPGIPARGFSLLAIEGAAGATEGMLQRFAVPQCPEEAVFNSGAEWGGAD